MSQYADELRKQSNILLQGAASILNGLGAGTEELRMRLIEAQSQPTIEAMRAVLDQVIASLATQEKLGGVVKATACLVTGNVYAAMADQSDFLMGSGAMKTVVDKLRKRSGMNAAIRLAAAKGDWDEFDRITADALSGLGNGELPTEPASGSAAGGADAGGDQTPGTAGGSGGA